MRRIALVGDSMVAAVATAEDRTLAHGLEQLLAGARPDATWEVMNAGVSSSSTGSELALYREVLRHYSPELVVLVFWVGNDLADNSLALTRAPRLYFDLDPDGRLRQLPYAFQPSPVVEWLDRTSRLYVWQKAALRQARASLRARGGAVDPVELVFASPEPDAVAHAWAITGALLRAFQAETRSRGARLVLVEAPAPVQVYDDLWAELEGRATREKTPLARDHPEERLGELCAAAGIPFLALAPAFRDAAPHRDSTRGDEQLYYQGRFHWNDAGNSLAAARVRDFARYNGPMKRSWYGLLLLALLAPACKSAPKAPPAANVPLPDLLRPYEAALRILPHKGDVKALTLKAGLALAGTCDVAVRVRSVAFANATVRFALEAVGLPRVGERRVSCKSLEPRIELALTGLPAGPVTADTTALIDAVLLTPEAYLKSKGTAFDRPAGTAPTEVASQLPDASEAERRLTRAVVAWPRQLLSVDATYRDPSGGARHERLVGVEAVVGTDGRLYKPQVKVSVDRAHEAAILGALSFWRFEPARRADAPVGARMPLEVVLRVY